MISRQEARKIATEVVGKMTLAEKIDQIYFRAPAIPRLAINEYNYWSEGLHGVARAGVATMFPQAIGLAATFDDQLIHDVAEVISIEGRVKYNYFTAVGDRDIYKGLTYWSPNLNLFRDPRWGRGQETYGEDPIVISKLGNAFIKGLQGEGEYLRLAACAKHFAVHSGPEADRHSFDARVTLKDLFEFYLPAFKTAVEEAEVESLMGSYNAINGVPACVNEELLQEILRKQWQFEGHVVSDYGALEDVYQHHQYVATAAETMALAMKVGCHLCAGEISSALFEAYIRGIVTEEEITESVIALYTTRARLGMFDTACEFQELPYELNDSIAHQELNRKVAQRSIVLLKNENLLPLDKKKLNTIAVIGPNASSELALKGNYFGTASSYHTFLSGVKDEVADSVRVYYALGCHLVKDHAESSLSKPNERESEAVIVAQQADVVVLCLGLDATLEGEQGDGGNIYAAGDREEISLPEPQKRLLNAILKQGNPVILVLASGSAISLDGLETHPLLKSIIQTWYPGSLGGKALADILFGNISPSGKLPVTFYQSVKDLPNFTDYSMSNRTYQNSKAEVLYPFGYGLTYGKSQVTKMLIENAENIVITIEMKNDSEWLIEEVVQIYGKIEGSIYAPKNWKLVEFQRIQLNGNEKKSISLSLDKSCLKVVDEKGNYFYDGEYVTFYAGFSQPDERSLQLTGQPLISQRIQLNQLIGKE
ncbi:glycoside hydrolase family 3 C-terminal domain-containing protein [Enterococcus sp. LJL99]